MFDAEIAATLLNRWDRMPAHEDPSPLDLLREGKLHFKRERGEVRAEDGPSANWRLSVECLTFADGSRALRITDPDAQHDWSRWVAAEPARKRETTAFVEHADLAC